MLMNKKLSWLLTAGLTSLLYNIRTKKQLFRYILNLTWSISTTLHLKSEQSIFYQSSSQAVRNFTPLLSIPQYACTRECLRFVWHAVFMVYVSSWKEQEQQPVRVWWTYRLSCDGHWNTTLLGSACWPASVALSEEWYDNGSAEVWQIEDFKLHPLLGRWNLLIGLQHRGSVCSSSEAFVPSAECWWYKCYNRAGWQDGHCPNVVC